VTAFNGEDSLVGLVAAGAVFWVLAVLRRGLRDARLPVGRSYVRRDERPGAFRTVAILYGAAALLLAFIALDLLFALRMRIPL
jgi:hypothetical protein